MLREYKVFMIGCVLFFVNLIILYGFFIGCQWQAETALINEHNGWPFAWLLQSIKLTNWQAWDLFLGLMDYLAIFLAVEGFIFGFWARDYLEKLLRKNK